MSVSFQFQQDRSNNPILKQEVLEVVASLSRLSRSNDATHGAFWRAASAGRTGSGLTGLFHRGPATATSLATSANASLASTNVVFFISKSLQIDSSRGYTTKPSFDFMLNGRTCVVVTGSVGQSFSSDRKAVAIESRMASAVVQATNQMLSRLTHRHAPTTAADAVPAAAVPAPIAAVQLPAAFGVAAAVFNRARANSDQSSSTEDLYQNQPENAYENA